jgi:hypothetical protein
VRGQSQKKGVEAFHIRLLRPDDKSRARNDVQ